MQKYYIVPKTSVMSSIYAETKTSAETKFNHMSSCAIDGYFKAVTELLTEVDNYSDSLFFYQINLPIGNLFQAYLFKTERKDDENGRCIWEGGLQFKNTVQQNRLLEERLTKEEAMEKLLHIISTTC